MPILAHTQQDQIKTRVLARQRFKNLGQDGLIGFGRYRRLKRVIHRINLRHRDADVIEQRGPGQPKVTVGVIQGNQAFIGPEDVPGRPIDLRAERFSSQRWAEQLGQRATGQRHRKPAAFGAGLRRQARDICRRGFAQRLRSVKDMELSVRFLAQ